MNTELSHYGVKGMKWGVRRYRNKDGSLTPLGKKKNEIEVKAEARKRNTDLFDKSNNYAADRINDSKWLSDYNKKWNKEFEKYDRKNLHPKYNEYEEEFTKKVIDVANEYLKTDESAQFTTKVGETYTARFIEKYGEEYGREPVWATAEEWAEYESKRKG